MVDEGREGSGEVMRWDMGGGKGGSRGGCCLGASISSALHYLMSASSCCILAWPSRMAAKSEVTLASAVGPASSCFVTPTLLRVETIVDSMWIAR